MSPLTVLAFIITLAAGWFLGGALLPRGLAPRWAGLLLRGSLAPGFGLGIVSMLHFALLGAAVASPWVTLSLLAAAALAAWRLPPEPVTAATPTPPRLAANWLLAGAAIGCLLLMLASIHNSHQTLPHGEWDAWSIWNLRARYLAGPGESWKHAFSPLLARNHPGYPLLTCSAIAALWKAGSTMDTTTPYLVAVAFFLGVCGTLASSLSLLRSVSAGLAAPLVLFTSATYMVQPAALYADVPLSYFLLATLALGALAWQSGSARLMGGAALLASCAAWTKNEGIVFAVMALPALLVLGAIRRPAADAAQGAPSGAGKTALLPAIAAGAAPGLVLVVVFKLLLAPPAEMGGQAISGALARLGDLSRYSTIAAAVWREALAFGSGWTHPGIVLAVLGIVWGWRVTPQQRPILAAVSAVLALQMAAYVAVYLITPEALAWQLDTSLARLYAQLWPAALFALFLALGEPEQLSALPGPHAASGTQRTAKKKGR